MGRPLMGGAAGEERTRALLALRLLPGVGDRTVQGLLQAFGTPERAMAARRGAFAALTSQAAASEKGRGDIWRRVDDQLLRIEALGLATLALGVDGYPDALNQLADPPTLLFLKGDAELLQRRTVAIVGARKATGYGRRTSEALARELASHGVNVVSGMALGVDSAAHRGALDAGGATLAVLGSGLDIVYPPSNRGLFRRIAQNGLLVSEFLPGEAPLPHHFLRRNRIIAALSSGLVVVEAGGKSGALTTVKYALELGRDVFACPGPAEGTVSAGVGRLLADGAPAVTAASEVLRALRWERETPEPDPFPGEPPEELGPDARLLWDEMETGLALFDDLLERSGLSSARGLAAISLLELSGWAVQEPGLRFARPIARGGAGDAPDA